jgi:hypothetical protein
MAVPESPVFKNCICFHLHMWCRDSSCVIPLLFLTCVLKLVLLLGRVEQLMHDPLHEPIWGHEGQGQGSLYRLDRHPHFAITCTAIPLIAHQA